MTIEKLLKIREILKRKRPKFVREEATRKRKLKKNWRKPRGLQNKTKAQREGHNKLVKVGYKSPTKVRHLTKEGNQIIRINNIQELNKTKDGSTIIIAKTSKKNKAQIIKRAIEKKIQITNAKDPQKELDKIEKDFKERKEQKKKQEKKKEDKIKKAETTTKNQEQKETPKEAQAESNSSGHSGTSSTNEKKEQDKKELDKILTKKE